MHQHGLGDFQERRADDDDLQFSRQTPLDDVARGVRLVQFHVQKTVNKEKLCVSNLVVVIKGCPQSSLT